MRKFVVVAGLPALFLSLSACEATLMSEQLDYHEMQGVSFMVYREEDAVLGGAQIVHRAHNPHAQPVCARVAGQRWVIVQPGQTADIAYQGPGATSARHEVGPVKPGGGC
ncbi:hypothetical protein [Brevundimonas fluminis]|jgi:hypothetical protein|uniref:hypothetical protein n=1 Tax=Brevundimonas fluminis TaxID=2487274 RepID=UPI000F658CF2|nr:hypothetical protein [Brevundimonas fluminis]